MTDNAAHVLSDIAAERERQVSLGWTREHDDRHYTDDLVRLAERQLRKPGVGLPGIYSRSRLIEAAALLVAAVEAMDRRDDRG